MGLQNISLLLHLTLTKGLEYNSELQMRVKRHGKISDAKIDSNER
jgi:hypothetical protein